MMRNNFEGCGVIYIKYLELVLIIINNIFFKVHDKNKLRRSEGQIKINFMNLKPKFN